ncbi:MAG: D-hexose-6-phosphate mutarotase [Proteobacteria bacterium]|nr:D-hexose-6-phosphate mutarotase [Pseudomonadota bacterium]
MSDPARHAIPGRVAFEESPLGGTVARLTHGDAECLVALHGAHVLNWTFRGEGLLWLSPVARIREGKGIRGGVPVCWPWFADTAGPDKPAHGFVRTRRWEVVRSFASTHAVSLALRIETTAADRALFPHHADACLTVTLGDGLEMSLITHNLGDSSFTLTQALHTYFRVSDIANVSVAGLAGIDYLDKLEGFARKPQSGCVRFEGEVDRIYVGDTSKIELRDAGSHRRILIGSSGSASAVVWNPWTEKTARLGDMGSPDAFRQMVCIETANAGDDVITLAPGASEVLTARYRVGGI